jgi:hypothetical protein
MQRGELKSLGRRYHYQTPPPITAPSPPNLRSVDFRFPASFGFRLGMYYFVRITDIFLGGGLSIKMETIHAKGTVRIQSGRMRSSERCESERWP